MKNIKNIVQYDSKTGELLEGLFIYFPGKQNAYSKGWLMSSQDALDLLANDTELSKYALRVFLKLCAKLDFENFIYISQSDIASELQLQKSHVSEAIKQLINKDILLKGDKVGRSFAYRLNPDYGWKGKVKNLNEYRKELEDQERSNMKRNHLKSYQGNNVD